MAEMEEKQKSKQLDSMILLFRIITLIVFGIYLVSTYSLIDYQQFLKFQNVLYIFIVIKDLSVLLVFYLYLFFSTIVNLAFGVRLHPGAGYLLLVGFTGISPNFQSILNDPASWLLSISNNFVSGLMSLFVLIIALLVLGYINTGRVNLGIWVFFLAEMSLILAVIFNMQSFVVPRITSPVEFASSPFLVHSIIALIFVESLTQLSYFSVFLIPLKDRIKRNSAVINRFESLTPEKISEGVEEEIKGKKIVEKLSPIAAYFTSESYIGTVAQTKFSMRYLAKLKNYYDFMVSKDPELRDKLVGLKTAPTWTDAFIRSLLYLVLKIVLVVFLAFAVLSLPQLYFGTVIGSRILELTLIEFYIIYVATAIMLLYVLGEFLRKI